MDMTEKKPAKKSAKSVAERTSTTFSDDEKSAMRERAKEAKSEVRRKSGDDAASDVAAVLEKLAAMSPEDRAMGERLHAIITANAPTLAPKLWYGMPAYAKDGTVLCFFQDARKFKT